MGELSRKREEELAVLRSELHSLRLAYLSLYAARIFGGKVKLTLY